MGEGGDENEMLIFAPDERSKLALRSFYLDSRSFGGRDVVIGVGNHSARGLMFVRVFGFALLAILLLVSSAHAQHSAAREWNEELLAAIRINVPNPPAHARNLFHTAVAMYDAWAAYDQIAVGYLYHEKISPLPPTLDTIESARREAISYAAYRMLRSRFASGVGSAATLASLDAKLTALGYSPALGQAPTTSAQTPAELGKRIADAILDWGASDGFSNVEYPQAYTSAVN